MKRSFNPLFRNLASALAVCWLWWGCATTPPEGLINPPVQGTASKLESLPLPLPGHPAVDLPDDGPVKVGSDEVFIDELPESPGAAFEEGLAGQIDWLHDATFLKVQRSIDYVDRRFVGKSVEAERVPVSRFRLGVYVDAVSEKDLEFGFAPEFDIKLKMPNIERHLSLFVTTKELGELPGTDLADRDEGVRLGVSRKWRKHFSTAVGVKWDWPPEPFVQLKWHDKWRAGAWQLYPSCRVFWRLEEGFGTTGVFTADRWKGRGLLRFSSGGKWTEESDGFEWSQTAILGYAQELLEEDRLGGRASGRDLARGGGVRYLVKGDTEVDPVRSHEVLLFYKFPLRKEWAYFVVGPSVRARNERDWEIEPGIQLGVDLLFWGIGDR
jgi:hypothetical protein